MFRACDVHGCDLNGVAQGRRFVGLLGKEALLGIKRQEKDVEIPGVGTVRIREIGGIERDQWELENRLADKQPMVLANFRARFVALHLIDESGALMFSNGGANELGRSMPGQMLDKLFDECRVLSGIGQQATEDAEKN